MKHIQDNLKQRGIPVFRIDGTVSKENRDEQIKLFKEASPNAVFIIQIKSGGQGLNLQQATRVYIMSPLGTRQPSYRPLEEVIDLDKRSLSMLKNCFINERRSLPVWMKK